SPTPPPPPPPPAYATTWRPRDRCSPQYGAARPDMAVQPPGRELVRFGQVLRVSLSLSSALRSHCTRNALATHSLIFVWAVSLYNNGTNDPRNCHARPAAQCHVVHGSTTSSYAELQSVPGLQDCSSQRSVDSLVNALYLFGASPTSALLGDTIQHGFCVSLASHDPTIDILFALDELANNPPSALVEPALQSPTALLSANGPGGITSHKIAIAKHRDSPRLDGLPKLPTVLTPH
ncbi:hypothetical protein SCUP515_08405, partial [Seiridium cupressi]